MVGAAALAVLAVAALVVLGRIGPGGLSAATVQDSVRGAGAWAPALFVVLQVLVTVPPVPRTIFTLAAGLLFGSVVGVAIAVSATALSAVVAFWLVRLTGGDDPAPVDAGARPEVDDVAAAGGRLHPSN